MSTFHAYVDAAHFHEALGNVLRFAAKRSRLPILEEAQVRFEDGHCVLTCTNLDQWCMSTIPAVGDSFSFVFVGTRKILSACKYFSGELELTYTIEPTETNPDPRGQISISDGKRSLKRSTERTSDFPELKEKPLDRHYPVNPKRLLGKRHLGCGQRGRLPPGNEHRSRRQCGKTFLHSAGGHGRAYDVQGSGLHDLRWRGVGGG